MGTFIFLGFSMSEIPVSSGLIEKYYLSYSGGNVNLSVLKTFEVPREVQCFMYCTMDSICVGIQANKTEDPQSYVCTMYTVADELNSNLVTPGAIKVK